MAVFLKLAALATAICGGTLLTMWLLFAGLRGLAGLALIGEAVLAIGSIWLLARDRRRDPLGGVGSDRGSV
jgi:hypothetical protein